MISTTLSFVFRRVSTVSLFSFCITVLVSDFTISSQECQKLNIIAFFTDEAGQYKFYKAKRRH
jgi:hypothetical protein